MSQNTNLSGILPSSVEVTFPVLLSEPNSVNPDVYVSRVEISDILDGMVGSNGSKIMHDTAGLSPGSDSVELDDLANQLAIDFYDFQSVGHDVCYDGVVLWAAEGLSDCLIFTYDANEITTRILTGPLNNYPEEFMHAACPESSSGLTSSTEVPSQCSFFTGSVQQVTDVTCDGVNFYFQSVTKTYDCGVLSDVSIPNWQQEGCCSCPNSSSSGSSSS